MSDRTTLCRCGHPRWRHFEGSMVKGPQACLALEGKTPCECRCFSEPQKKEAP
jgi:hypothetical protein